MVAVLAPTDAPLLGLVSVIAPIMAGGNACVVVAAEADPCVAITFAEVLATSDVPAGVVNLLTGRAPRSPRTWPPTPTSTPST